MFPLTSKIFLLSSFLKRLCASSSVLQQNRFQQSIVSDRWTVDTNSKCCTMPAAKKPAAAGGRKTAKGYRRPVELTSGTEINSASTSASSSSSSHKQSWIVGELLGHGGFGDVYVADTSRSKVSTSKSQYVVKVEPQDNGPLFVETKFFKAVAGEKQLADFKRKRKLQHVGIPTYYDSGVFDYKTNQLRYLVIQRLGTALDAELQKLPYSDGKRRLPFAVVCELTMQLIDALSFIHSQGFTHDDIKENNVMLAWPKPDAAFLIDFGLSSRFLFDNSKHREYKENPKSANDGTLEFTSIDSHNGVSGARRSDLQILGFCMTKLACGKLPWDGVDKPPTVAEQKAKYMAKPELFFQNAAEPCHELELYWKQVSALKYEEEPKYDKLRSIFEARASRGLFSVPKNLAMPGATTTNLNLPSSSSSSRQRSESPTGAATSSTKTVQARAALRRKPAAAASMPSSSKRSKSSTSPSTSDDDDDGGGDKVDTARKDSATSAASTSSSTSNARAERAAKRSKLKVITESSDDDEKKKPAKKTEESKTRTKKSNHINDDDTDADSDAVQVIDHVSRTSKLPQTSSSSTLQIPTRKHSATDSPNITRHKQPVLMLPVNASPLKKRLQHYNAEIIYPVPEMRRPSSKLSQSTSTAAVNGAKQTAAASSKNPFNVDKFATTATTTSSSSQQQQSSQHAAATSSSSQCDAGSKPTVHKKLLHYDQEISVIAEEEEKTSSQKSFKKSASISRASQEK